MVTITDNTQRSSMLVDRYVCVYVYRFTKLWIYSCECVRPQLLNESLEWQKNNFPFLVAAAPLGSRVATQSSGYLGAMSSSCGNPELLFH